MHPLETTHSRNAWVRRYRSNMFDVLRDPYAQPPQAHNGLSRDLHRITMQTNHSTMLLLLCIATVVNLHVNTFTHIQYSITHGDRPIGLDLCHLGALVMKVYNFHFPVPWISWMDLWRLKKHIGLLRRKFCWASRPLPLYGRQRLRVKLQFHRLGRRSGHATNYYRRKNLTSDICIHQ